MAGRGVDLQESSNKIWHIDFSQRLYNEIAQIYHFCKTSILGWQRTEGCLRRVAKARQQGI